MDSLGLDVSTAATSVNYSWNTSDTTATIWAQFDSTYTYAVTISNAVSQCIDSVKVLVGQSVVGLPDYTINCPNDTVFVSVDSTFSYYNWSNGDTTFATNFNQTGTYTLAATDSLGCYSSDTLEVIILNPIEIQATIDSANCYNSSDGSIVLAVSPLQTYSYAWSNNPNNTTTSNGSLSPGNYQVTVSLNATCYNILSYTIPSNDTLNYTAQLVEPSCFNFQDGAITVTPTGGATPYSIAWQTGANVFNPNTLSGGNYWFVLTDANQCSDTFFIDLPQPTPVNLAVNQLNEVCQGDTVLVDLVASGGHGAPYTYAVGGVPISNHLEFVLNQDTTMNFVTTDSAGCLSSAQGYVLDAIEAIVIVGPDTVNYCDSNLVNLAFATTDGNHHNYHFTWSWDNTDSCFATTPVLSSQLEVKVDEACNAKGTKNVAFVQYKAPQAAMDFEAFISCFGAEIQAVHNSSNGENIFWYNSQTQQLIQTAANTITLDVDQLEGLYYIAQNPGCSDTLLVDVPHVLDSLAEYSIPAVFTPNGDGINDLFELPALFNANECTEVEIFNRWGTRVYKGAMPWDGTVQNKRITDETVYFYRLTVAGFEYHGTLSQLR